eukprot:CAMPEP_0114509246 /NCGR_PEP_ID=MMETSP0109-20121206/13093_1 /TAXON_ID=29199 /ORGANISM="Chlorarachnion reptans, Strain CCCM449" /LENGTH=34 /DNA_ID= /DNA_START= /DNA_END= /DNA_ORIENTATION=
MTTAMTIRRENKIILIPTTLDPMLGMSLELFVAL